MLHLQILVAYDRTPDGDIALEHALKIFDHRFDHVWLVSVLPFTLIE